MIICEGLQHRINLIIHHTVCIQLIKLVQSPLVYRVMLIKRHHILVRVKIIQIAENISFGLDMKILWMTLKQVLGHSETVVGDTSAAEGNLAAIRKARKEADKDE